MLRMRFEAGHRRRADMEIDLISGCFVCRSLIHVLDCSETVFIERACSLSATFLKSLPVLVFAVYGEYLSDF